MLGCNNSYYTYVSINSSLHLFIQEKKKFSFILSLRGTLDTAFAIAENIHGVPINMEIQ